MLSEALKRHRKRKGWSLRELANRCGISASALSKVERGDLSLTYDKLQSLADGLDIEISALFQIERDAPGNQPTSRRSFASETDGELLKTSNYLHRYPHMDIVKKALVPIIADVNSQSLAEFGPLVRHHGEEYSFVLCGEVTLFTEHYAPMVVKAGESVYFDSEMAHAYINSGDGPARIICVTSESPSSKEI